MQKEPWNDDNGMQCSLQIRCKSLTPNRWSSTSQEAAKRDSRNTLSGNMEVGDQVAGNLAVNFLLGTYGLTTEKTSWPPTGRHARRGLSHQGQILVDSSPN